MKKYLYLNRKEWVSPWTKGGVVPLYQASRYLSDEREGVFTPDENLIDTSTHDIKAHGDLVIMSEGGMVAFHDPIINGVHHPGTIKFEQRVEDGLVLCLANKKSTALAIKMGKEACIEISNIHQLKCHLDKQIGVVGVMKACEYTEGHQRNHFLKSHLDAWQDEFRIFWPGVNTIRVAIPGGIAKEVRINKPKIK